jgi:hypothetical protein
VPGGGAADGRDITSPGPRMRAAAVHIARILGLPDLRDIPDIGTAARCQHDLEHGLFAECTAAGEKGGICYPSLPAVDIRPFLLLFHKGDLTVA